MLARMLLHVIEPPGPVDLTLDIAFHRTVDHVSDAIAFVNDVSNGGSSNPASIKRLAP